ncbi:hypothetical protein J2X65_002057 [Ancylobacter sp. 3268]|uniref:hypothetical protein n=1 Tax=Ancylobacter sp. 3268 TaxID=2817752 RepID=UPI0028611FC1|nr:hypothetical protein [Ancylobacter sp. 3268]MDR6952698.1 hypothetical protein [Ancylobacter sp. 3268]
MPSEQQPAEREPIVISETDVEEAIATCGGDARATVMALLIGQQFLEAELEKARQEASWGYVRGRPSRRLKDAAQG